MDNKKLNLEPNFVFGSLLDEWYIWNHLISPPGAAMNMETLLPEIYKGKELLFEKQTSCI
jgi:hypothetical protein